jgi:hypothetical protein
MRRISVFLLLCACTAPPAAEVTMRAADRVGPAEVVSAPSNLLQPALDRPLHGNADLARNFLDLEFRMESGRPLPALTRFDGPITVGLAGRVPPGAAQDLARLVSRLRAEAGLDIRVASGQTARITVEFLPRRTMARRAPTAACFVVPNVGSFAEYRATRNAPETDWISVTRRDRAAVFIPDQTSPQEVRDCLHEELAQAIGPLNDLYRLTDSVFNDDNFNSVLTPFDMLMLRIHYAPELANGMTEPQVASLLPDILGRINPAGIGQPPTVQALGPHSWTEAVEATFGADGGKTRLALAQRMLAIARAQGWADARLGLALYAVGRAQLATDPQAAEATLLQAGQVYAGLPGGHLHVAHVDMQLAALALQSGRPEQAVALCDPAIWVARRAENPGLAATLMLIRAAALDAMGQHAAAKAQRLDAAPLARYGFGSDKEIRARMGEIALLAARNGG